MPGALPIPTMPSPIQTFAGMNSNQGMRRLSSAGHRWRRGTQSLRQSVNSSIQILDKLGNALGTNGTTYNSFFSALGTARLAAITRMTAMASCSTIIWPIAGWSAILLFRVSRRRPFLPMHWCEQDERSSCWRLVALRGASGSR